LFHAARADLLRRLGRDEEAAAAYDVARSLTANPVEHAFLDAQHAAVLAPGVTEDKESRDVPH
jgi:RNA polymerase sigma-70 factor (ECF subfamily)